MDAVVKSSLLGCSCYVVLVWHPSMTKHYPRHPNMINIYPKLDTSFNTTPGIQGTNQADGTNRYGRSPPPRHPGYKPHCTKLCSEKIFATWNNKKSHCRKFDREKMFFATWNNQKYDCAKFRSPKNVCYLE